MTEEDTFLLEILSRPDDEVPRLIYCDWLADHDDPRAEWNRLGWTLRDSPPTAKTRAALAEQVRKGCEENGWVYHDGLVLTWEHLVLVFRMRLAETIAFCAGRPLPLRTEEIDPFVLMDLKGDHFDDHWPELLAHHALARRRILDRHGRAPTRPASNLLGGRVMWYVPAGVDVLSESTHYSDGYFDVLDCPPWDTWLMHVPEEPGGYKACMIAWVPRDHLARARTGIDVNDSGRIGWIEDRPSPFTRRLREAGVLHA